VKAASVTANGKPIETKLPDTLQELLVALNLVPRRVPAGQICRVGHEPVWKDWDAALTL